MDGHLDTRLRARALEHDIVPIRARKLCEHLLGVLSCPTQLLVRPHGSRRIIGGREAIRPRGKTVAAREIKSLLVDVDGHDLCSAVVLGERTGEDAYRADTEHEDALALGKASAPTCVYDDGQGLCESSELKGTPVR